MHASTARAGRRQLMSLAALGGLVFAWFATPSAAVEVGAARAFVEETADEVLALITSRESDTAKSRKFRRLLERKGAISDVARVAIGRAWNDMSPGQKARYQDALVGIVTRISVDGFKQYSGDRLRIVDATKQGSSVFVRTLLVRGSAGGKPIDVVWRIIDRNGPLQLFDLTVDGVSLLRTQRETLIARLNANGGDVERFIRSLEAEAAGSG